MFIQTSNQINEFDLMLVWMSKLAFDIQTNITNVKTKEPHMTLLEFKNHYQKQMKELTSQKEMEISSYLDTQREDEAKFARIELNIIDIFEKMFTACLAKVKTFENEPGSGWVEPLQTAYLGFFDKIPTAWHQNLEKCMQFDSHEEAHIEKLKIAMADVVKEMFLSSLTLT